MKGQPLWFLGTALGGWFAIRAAMLWPAAVPSPLAILAPQVAATTRPPASKPIVPLVRRAEAAPIRRTPLPAAPALAAPPPAQPRVPFAGPIPVVALAAPPQVAAGIPLTRPDEPLAPPPTPAAYIQPRLSGSGWAIVRGGGTIPFASQLGGSQAGMRLTYAVDGPRRLALAGRFASALRTRQQEAAVGLDWRPTALPIHLVAEQRIGIANARGGPALGLVGGIGPVPIVGAVRIDAYAQGGAIARAGVEGYADGAIRLSQPVAALGPARIELGLAAWGGAQRGAARLDVGPAAALSLPVAARTLRLSLEWRQRIAGRAAPGSGPALAIGTDF